VGLCCGRPPPPPFGSDTILFVIGLNTSRRPSFRVKVFDYRRVVTHEPAGRRTIYDVFSPASGSEAFGALKDRISATPPNKNRNIALSEASRRVVVVIEAPTTQYLGMLAVKLPRFGRQWDYAAIRSNPSSMSIRCTNPT